MGANQTKLSNLTPEEAEALEQMARVAYGTNKGYSFGPFIIGYAAVVFFYALLLTQVLKWFRRSARKDTWVIRSLVFAMWSLCTIYVILTSDYMVHQFAYGFGTYRQFYNFSWITTFLLLDMLIQTPVSAFFAVRAYRLSGKNKILGFINIVLLIVAFGSCIGLKISSPNIATEIALEEYMPTVILLIIWASTAMITDIIVTSTIICALVKANLGFTGFDRTEKLIRRVVVLSVEAQMIPTLCSAAFIVTFGVTRGGNLSAIWMCTPQIYALAFLAILNLRETLSRDITPAIHHPPTGLSHLPSFHLSMLQRESLEHRGPHPSRVSPTPSEIIRAHLGEIDADLTPLEVLPKHGSREEDREYSIKEILMEERAAEHSGGHIRRNSRFDGAHSGGSGSQSHSITLSETPKMA
ncbi:hypothetical protein IAT38_005000 [Cryptococcus sp. DSM 104549]